MRRDIIIRKPQEVDSIPVVFASAGALLTRFPSMPDQQQTTNLPRNSESFRTVPKAAEGFGNIPNDTGSFRTIRNVSERTENHTLTVREAARMFEAAGVGRTERSIINWCQPNKTGVARLDCYFDPNDRKYYITCESIELAIAEEKAKAGRPVPSSSGADMGGEGYGGGAGPSTAAESHHSAETNALQHELMDLRITNRAKDYIIDQLQKDREAFAAERKEYVEKLMTFNRKVGELETQLLQLRAPVDSSGSHISPERFPTRD